MRWLSLGLALALNGVLGYLFIQIQDQKQLQLGGATSRSSYLVDATYIPQKNRQPSVSIEVKREYYRSLNQNIVTSRESIQKINQQISERHMVAEKALALQKERERQQALAEEREALAQEKNIQEKIAQEKIEKQKRAQELAQKESFQKSEQKAVNRSPAKISNHERGKAADYEQSGGVTRSAGFGSVEAKAAVEANIMGNIEQCYPRISRRRGEEGVAVLSLIIDQNNRVLEIRIDQSTGFERLDQCAKSAVQKATETASFLSALQQGSKVQGVIKLRPIRFRLK